MTDREMVMIENSDMDRFVVEKPAMLDLIRKYQSAKSELAALRRFFADAVIDSDILTLAYRNGRESMREEAGLVASTSAAVAQEELKASSGDGDFENDLWLNAQATMAEDIAARINVLPIDLAE
jgi:hypothetical protein